MITDRLAEIEDETDITRARALLSHEAETAAECIRRSAAAIDAKTVDAQLATMATLADMLRVLRSKL